MSSCCHRYMTQNCRINGEMHTQFPFMCSLSDLMRARKLLQASGGAHLAEGAAAMPGLARVARGVRMDMDIF